MSKKLFLLFGTLCLLLCFSCSKKDSSPKSNSAEGILAIEVNQDTLAQIINVNKNDNLEKKFVIECFLSGDYTTSIKKIVTLKDLENLDFLFTDIPANSNVTVSLVISEADTYGDSGTELYCGEIDNIIMDKNLPSKPVNIVLGDSPAAPKNNKTSLGVSAPMSKNESSALFLKHKKQADAGKGNSKEQTPEQPEEETAPTIRQEDFDFNADFEKALNKTNETQAITVEEKVILPPDPVSNLQVKFDWKKNKIKLTWDEPENEDFAGVEIKNNKNNNVIVVPKGTKTYSFPISGKDTHKYIVTSINTSGMEGHGEGGVVENPYIFESFSAPTVANTGVGKPVTAIVKGINFTKLGITPRDFDVHCYSQPSVTKNAKITVVDENTLSIKMFIPKKDGNFAIVVNCGEVKFTGSFLVLNYSSSPIGKIISDKGTPVAVIAGYDSLGYPFGVSLQDSKSLKWATESTFGYDTCFDEIVSQPSVVGTNSAIKATFNGDIDGYDNWDEITKVDEKCLLPDGSIDYNYAQKTYPIFYYALTYGKTASIPATYADGWFIPSISELSQIFANREEIQASLLEAGGKPFLDDFYWSSTQNDYNTYNACALRFLNGAIFKYYFKSNAVYTRCVRMFK